MIEKVKIQEQYLMLKCSNAIENEQKSKILGVWIHDDDVRKNAKDSIDRILKANNRPDDLLQKFNNIKSYASVTGTSVSGARVETPSSTVSIAPSTPSVPTTTEPAKIPENKSTQLLSFLKKSSTEAASKESTTAAVSPAAAPAAPVNSGVKLLSLLTKSPQPAQPVAVTVPSTSRTESGSTTPSPSGQKAEHLLSLLSNASLSSRNTSPSGSDLMTDGDIAKVVKANQSAQKQSPPSSTTRSRGNSGSDLLAALIEPPKPPSNSKPQPPVAAILSSTSAKLSTGKTFPSSNLIVPKSSIELRAQSPVINGKPLIGTGLTSGSAKKPVFLISPSDLED
eukprot:CAMPEP_0173153948 /NCGR_PEP_ID=MMETSP1105-20130129/13173_1 /TAXON_ID=2985 /ORGANISM="Ochromonas sp., Strain BG-1" /LENGTH=337 /DNA_ID=CAMNT_0014069999 /DNA_START=285 /DNA_END=1298 /DNA_ORIENTATION=-